MMINLRTFVWEQSWLPPTLVNFSWYSFFSRSLSGTIVSLLLFIMFRLNWRKAYNIQTKGSPHVLYKDKMTREITTSPFPFCRYKQDNGHLKSEIEQLKDRLTSLNQEYELANEARVSGLEKVDELKRKSSKLEQERDAANRTMTKEVCTMRFPI